MKLNNKEKLDLEVLSYNLDIDIEGITFHKVWMPFGNAFFFILMPNTVLLNKKVLKAHGVWDLIDEVAHELVHRDQWRKDGTIKYLLKKTCCRLFMNNNYEKEAYTVQDEIDTLKRKG